MRPQPASPPALGVEEEFALLDPTTGQVALVAADVIRACRDARGVGAECMSYMVETRTPVCHTTAEVREALVTRRVQAAEEARRRGAVLVASGVAPFGVPDPPPLTPDPRYERLLAVYPSAMRTTGTCACHVHVSVPDPGAGVEVLGRLRPWLPALTALAANSPVWRGRDVGWASARYLFVTRWPTATPAPPVRSAAGYEEAVCAAIASGRAHDRRSVYFLARLSPRYPTVEVRVADVCLTVDEAVAYAGLVRALVAKALADAAQGRCAPAVDQDVLVRACRTGARYGMTSCLVDPTTTCPLPAWDYVDALVGEVLPHLERYDDADQVLSTLDHLRVAGGAAQRHRAMFTDAHDAGQYVTALAAATTGQVAAPARPTAAPERRQG
ncbi:MAG: carboxylate-amine ligase [Actinomycetes bacterium]